MSKTSRYEIFQKLPGKQAVWVETATSLDDARMRLKDLTLMFPADYFIFDTEHACFIIPQDCAAD